MMTDNIPETQFEAISRRRRELRASMGMSPVAPRELLTTFVGTLTSQFMSMMRGQPQMSPEEHQAQGNNGGGFGGFLSRFPRLQNRTAPPVEPPKDPNQPAEGDTIEWWTFCMKNDVKPPYGTAAFFEWERRQGEYRGNIWQLRRGHLIGASIDTKESGVKENKGASVAH